jgi:hypothetical protein
VVAEAEVVAAEHLGLAQLLQRRRGRGGGRRHRAIAGEVGEEREWWGRLDWGGVESVDCRRGDAKYPAISIHRPLRRVWPAPRTSPVAWFALKFGLWGWAM